MNLTDGQLVRFVATAQNSGPVTIQRGGHVRTLTWPNGEPIKAGDIREGDTVVFDIPGIIKAVVPHRSKGWRRHLRRVKAQGAKP